MTTSERQTSEGPATPNWLASRWLVPAVIALPFLVTIAALRGLTVTLPIFHSTDEGNYIYPTILQFAGQLPFPDLHHYVAAQTPLFPLVEAYIGKLVGLALWKLRLVEAAISYALGLALYLLLHRRLGLARLEALALSVLFVLSPYVFGSSFRAITDNLATLFIVLAIERFERFRQTESAGPFIAGCVALAAAMLTRQSAAFMLAVAGLYALRVGLGRRRDGQEPPRARPVRLLRCAGLLAAVAISAVPVGALFLSWHGLVPPGGDPSSCALCAPGRDVGATQGSLNVQTPELALATFGLYGAVLFAPLLLGAARAARRMPLRTILGALREAAIGLVLGAALLVAFPARPGIHSAGVLWNVAKRLPTPLGSSLLFWALVPLAGALLAWRARVGPRRWLLFAFLASFLVGALAIRYPWQKYVDPFALLALFFTVRGDELATPRQLAGAGVLAVAFVAYAISFVA